MEANADRRRLGEEHGHDVVAPGRRREHLQQDAGATFLHLHRHERHVDSAGGEESRGGVLIEFRAHVVDVGLDGNHRVGARHERRLAE